MPQPGSSVVKARASHDSRKDRLAALLNRLPVIGIAAVVVDCVRTCRIVFQAVGRSIWRTIVQKRAYSGLLVEDADAAPHNENQLSPRLIGEAKSRREIVFVRREDRADASSLDDKPFPGIKTARSLSPLCSGPPYS